MLTTNFRAIQQQYGQWLDALGFADVVQYKSLLCVGYFFQWLQTKNITTIQLVTQQHINQYFAYLEVRPNQRKKGGLNSATINQNFYAVDKLCEFLHQMGMKNAPVPTTYRLKLDKQQRIDNIHPLTQREVKHLYSSIKYSYPNWSYKKREAKHYQLRLVFALYYACGLRRSEGYRLTIDNVNLDARTIFIKKGKGYKDRIVPMSEGVYRDLQDYIYNFRSHLKLPHNRLFVSAHITLGRNLKYLQQISNDESIKSKKLTLHLLRHSIATHLLQNGMSIENIARFLGHTSLSSTQVYTHIQPRIEKEKD